MLFDPLNNFPIHKRTGGRVAEEPDWVFLTPEVNATLLNIREMAKEQGDSAEPDSITWGTIPLRD